MTMIQKSKLEQSEQQYLTDAEERFQQNTGFEKANTQHALEAIDARRSPLRKEVFFTNHPGDVPSHIVQRRAEKDEAKANSMRSKAKKTLALAGVVIAAGGASQLMGRAMDHEIKSGEPPAYLKSKVGPNGLITFTPENFPDEK